MVVVLGCWMQEWDCSYSHSSNGSDLAELNHTNRNVRGIGLSACARVTGARCRPIKGTSRFCSSSRAVDRPTRRLSDGYEAIG
jgi:hypothetical protein